MRTTMFPTALWISGTFLRFDRPLMRMDTLNSRLKSPQAPSGLNLQELVTHTDWNQTSIGISCT